jgi:hypothetical protein
LLTSLSVLNFYCKIQMLYISVYSETIAFKEPVTDKIATLNREFTPLLT